MTAPRVPLLPEQVEAAQAIYSTYTPSWRRVDAALTALAATMPDFNADAVLLKAVVVNSLYGTNVYAIDHTAQHVFHVLDGVELSSAGAELVEAMATVRLPEGKTIRYRSFASKFAHFFIDNDRFPIHDSFAAKMLREHLGKDAPTPDSGATYMSIEAAFRALAYSAGLGSDTRGLDRYLWMIGQYRDWTKRPSAQINSELRGVFEADPPELAVSAGPWYRPVA
ncbi:hypothetical protein BH09ACT8_BH09ACT8_61520 [soil metagenome]